MGNEGFQNASSENASFGNGNEDSSCLCALFGALMMLDMGLLAFRGL